MRDIRYGNGHGQNPDGIGGDMSALRREKKPCGLDSLSLPTFGRTVARRADGLRHEARRMLFGVVAKGLARKTKHGSNEFQRRHKKIFLHAHDECNFFDGFCAEPNEKTFGLRGAGRRRGSQLRREKSQSNAFAAHPVSTGTVGDNRAPRRCGGYAKAVRIFRRKMH